MKLPLFAILALVSQVSMGQSGYCACTLQAVEHCECYDQSGVKMAETAKPKDQAKSSKFFTLITVTYGGDVGHSRGYETQRMCEQAKSVAQTGQTIEQRKELEESERARWAERTRRWREQHPARKPTAAEAKTCRPLVLLSDLKAKMPPRPCYGYGWKIDEDGLLYEDEPSEIFITNGSIPPSGAIKYAECVVELP